MFDNIWCWLWPLLTGIIGAILGYLLGKMSGGSSNCDEWIEKNHKLQADLDACRANAKSSASSAASFAAGAGAASMPNSFAEKAVAAAPAIPFDAAAAKAAMGKNIKQDDLKVVEGIGPKIEELFKSNGIPTWRALSEATADECQKVLNIGGKRYEIHKPRTWPEQAKMAYEGKWAALKKWQDELDGGK